MKAGWKAIVLAAPLFLTVACGQSNEASKNMEMKQAYSLCAKTDDARQRLYEQVKDFADQQHAQLHDRGASVKQELSELGSEVLKNTGGDPVLLTIEKTLDFRITVSNLGLEEKFVLTVRSWKKASKNGAVRRFMENLDRFWTIQEVDGAVLNDPPC